MEELNLVDENNLSFKGVLIPPKRSYSHIVCDQKIKSSVKTIILALIHFVNQKFFSDFRKKLQKIVRNDFSDLNIWNFFLKVFFCWSLIIIGRGYKLLVFKLLSLPTVWGLTDARRSSLPTCPFELGGQIVFEWAVVVAQLVERSL